MKIFDRVMNRFGYIPKKRGYNAAKVSRLTEDWLTTVRSQDSELRYSLANLRQRSRELYMNNDYARKFIKMVSNNIVGSAGITFQSRIKEFNGKTMQNDDRANRLIEDAWWKWGRLGSPEITGKMSWLDLQRISIEQVARDGEVFILIINDKNNPFRFTLQLIEADHVDEKTNRKWNGTSEIRMGIELDRYKKPIAYYVNSIHPGDYDIGQDKVQPIPADRIIHIFLQERPEQTRGVPWMASAMQRMNMIGAYEEAEVTAARVAACKMGFFYSDAGDEILADDKDDSGNLLTDAAPGTFENLPAGTKFQGFDPQHPTSNYGAFVKSVLRGVSAGLGVSYNALSSDLESVNYSSLRQGAIEERDAWKVLQWWFIDHFNTPIFERWLDMALLTKEVALPVAKYDKFNSPVWQPRGWNWIDPSKEVKANTEAIDAGLMSWTEVIAMQGKDTEEVFDQIAKDKQLAEAKGIELNLGNKQTSTFPEGE